MARQTLNAEERALWARVIASVRPIEGRAVEPPPVTPAKAGAQPAPSDSGPRPSPGYTSTTFASKPANTLDGSWDRRFSRGLVGPDLAVDLHGHTLDSAWRVLDQGLDHAIRSGARVMLLVTGKPPREGDARRGVIRAAVGDWLAASRHAGSIAAVRNAHPRHGGSGALYIVLRRRKPAP